MIQMLGLNYYMVGDKLKVKKNERFKLLCGAMPTEHGAVIVWSTEGVRVLKFIEYML